MEQNPYTDRITEILQSTAQPAPIDPNMFDAMAIGNIASRQGPQGFIESIRGMQEQAMQQARQDRMDKLQSAQIGYNMFEQQRQAGNQEAQAIFDRVSMISSDPQAIAQIIGELSLSEEMVTPQNALVKAAGIAKRMGIETDYSRNKKLEDLNIQKAQQDLRMGNIKIQEALRPQAPSLPSGVDLPEGYMPTRDEFGNFIGAKPVPGLEDFIKGKEKTGAGGKADETKVQGLDIVPGAEPTKDDAKIVKASVQAKKSIDSSLTNYRNLIKEVGAESPTSNDAKRLNQIRTEIVLQMKNLEELGALQEADRKVLDDLIGTSVVGTEDDWLPSVIGRPYEWMTAKSRALEQLDQFENYLKTRYASTLETRGYQAKGDVQVFKFDAQGNPIQ